MMERFESVTDRDFKSSKTFFLMQVKLSHRQSSVIKVITQRRRRLNSMMPRASQFDSLTDCKKACCRHMLQQESLNSLNSLIQGEIFTVKLRHMSCMNDKL